MEIWKDIKGYEGFYQVSNLGSVKSLERIVKKSIKNDCGYKKLKSKKVSIYKTNKGYNFIRICKDGEMKNLLLHRIIAESFIPNTENKPCINHINSIRSDNRIDNLEWVTYSENNVHRLLHKKSSSKYIGVSYYKYERGRKKWKCSITINNVRYRLGRYLTEEEAYNAYIKFIKENNIQNKYLNIKHNEYNKK